MEVISMEYHDEVLYTFTVLLLNYVEKNQEKFKEFLDNPFKGLNDMEVNAERIIFQTSQLIAGLALETLMDSEDEEYMQLCQLNIKNRNQCIGCGRCEETRNMLCDGAVWRGGKLHCTYFGYECVNPEAKAGKCCDTL
jgi:hypothetical protein